MIRRFCTWDPIRHRGNLIVSIQLLAYGRRPRDNKLSISWANVSTSWHIPDKPSSSSWLHVRYTIAAAIATNRLSNGKHTDRPPIPFANIDNRSHKFQFKNIRTMFTGSRREVGGWVGGWLVECMTANYTPPMRLAARHSTKHYHLCQNTECLCIIIYFIIVDECVISVCTYMAGRYSAKCFDFICEIE